MTNKTIEYLIQEHGALIAHLDLSKLLKRNHDSLRVTLERSNDPWIKTINQARRKIGGRVYYSIEMLAPLFSDTEEGEL